MSRYFLLLLLFEVTKSFCQDSYQNLGAENVSIASPNAASLGKFADFPISYHTGVPNVSIPVHTVTCGPIKLPISLDYHASGLKVAEQSSWIGAGWALNAGGVITRSVRGRPDEKSNAGYSYVDNHGYFNYLFDPAYDILGTTNAQRWAAIASGTLDAEADLFFFNFGGYSGKFMIRPDGGFDLFPQQDILIQYSLCQYCNSRDRIYAWTVTTPDGIKYSFGKTDITTDVDAVEYNQTYSQAGGLSFIETPSSWFLYKIESPDGRFQVNLTYEQEQYSYYSMSLFPVLYPVGTTGPVGMDLVKNFVYGVRLTSIAWQDGTITFTPEPTAREDLSNSTGAPTPMYDISQSGAYSAKALKTISISNNVSLCTKFELSHDYWTDDHSLKGYFAPLETTYNLHSDKKRLKLKSILETTCDNSLTKPPFRFEYEESITPPRTLSMAQDHWGYFNGAYANTTMFPPISINDGRTYSPGGDREASWPAMSAGALKRVQYPTGGFTEMDFESHDNGYSYQYFTYIKGAEVTSRSYGYSGASGNGPSESKHLDGGKYFLDRQWNLEANQSGVFHADRQNSTDPGYSFGISQNDPPSELVDLTAGDYSFYVYVPSSNSSNHGGAMATLYIAIPVVHTVYPKIGGLRIKAMRYRDGSASSNPVSQTFDYNGGGTTSQGVLFGKPIYASIIRNDVYRVAGIASDVTVHSNGCVATDGYFIGDIFYPTKFAYVMSPGSIYPMRSTQGAHIGYKQVKVSQADGGYTIHSFHMDQEPGGSISQTSINVSGACTVDIPNFPPVPDPHNFFRGEPLNEQYFDAGNTLLKKTEHFIEFDEENVGINGIVIRNLEGKLLATDYEQKSWKKTFSAEVENNYNPADPDGPATYRRTQSFFDSPYHHAPTKITFADNSSSAPPMKETRNFYVGDVIYQVPPEGGTCYDSFKATVDARVAAYTATLSGNCDHACRLEAWKIYYQALNNARISYVACRILNESPTVPNGVQNLDNESYRTDVRVLMAMKRRNELHRIVESSEWRDGKFAGAAFVTYKDFKTGSEPANTFLFPGKKELIQVSVPQDPGYFTPVVTAMAGETTRRIIIRDSTHYRTEESYLYRDSKPVEILDKSGVYTSYIWINDFPIIKARNIPYATLKSEYDAVGHDPVLLRARPVLSAAQLLTYTYSPLVGMTSETDLNNRARTYEYDKFARLKTIRDHLNNIVSNFRYDYLK